METKHTPGPWTWEKYSNGYSLVSETERVGSVRQAVDMRGVGNNANLIAAAPDLLEALEMIMNKNSSNFRLKAPDYLIDKIDAAISKAKGEK